MGVSWQSIQIERQATTLEPSETLLFHYFLQLPGQGINLYMRPSLDLESFFLHPIIHHPQWSF